MACERTIPLKGGYLAFLTTDEIFQTETDYHVLEWRSFKLPRVARSSLSAEAQACGQSADIAEYIARFWSCLRRPTEKLRDCMDEVSTLKPLPHHRCKGLVRLLPQGEFGWIIICGQARWPGDQSCPWTSFLFGWKVAMGQQWTPICWLTHQDELSIFAGRAHQIPQDEIGLGLSVCEFEEENCRRARSQSKWVCNAEGEEKWFTTNYVFNLNNPINTYNWNTTQHQHVWRVRRWKVWAGAWRALWACGGLCWIPCECQDDCVCPHVLHLAPSCCRPARAIGSWTWTMENLDFSDHFGHAALLFGLRFWLQTWPASPTCPSSCNSGWCICQFGSVARSKWSTWWRNATAARASFGRDSTIPFAAAGNKTWAWLALRWAPSRECHGNHDGISAETADFHDRSHRPPSQPDHQPSATLSFGRFNFSSGECGRCWVAFGSRVSGFDFEPHSNSRAASLRDVRCARPSNGARPCFHWALMSGISFVS